MVVSSSTRAPVYRRPPRHNAIGPDFNFNFKCSVLMDVCDVVDANDRWHVKDRLEVLESKTRMSPSQRCQVCMSFNYQEEPWIVGEGVILHESCSQSLGTKKVYVQTFNPSPCPEALSKALHKEHEHQLSVGKTYINYELFMVSLFVFNKIGLCRKCGDIRRLNSVNACEFCWIPQ